MQLVLEKFPPPSYWLKRLLLAYALLIPTLLATWFTWSWFAHRQLDRQIAAIRARNLPALPEDFDALQPAVPAAQNAALHYESAIALCVRTGPQQMWENGRTTNSITSDADFAMAADITATCQPALAEAYAAAELSTCRWSSLPSRSVTGLWPMLGPVRQLANTLQFAAYTHHHLGDDSAALRDINAIIHLGRAQCQGPTIIEQLVGVAIQSVASNTLMDVLPNWSIGNNPRQATPAQTRQLIALLLDDSAAAEDRRLGFLGEAAFIPYEMTHYYSEDPFTTIANLTPAAPLYQARQMAKYAQWGDAAAHDFYFDMQPLCDPEGPRPESRSFGEAIARLPELEASLGRAALLQVQSIADLRLAAIAAAIRLRQFANPQAPLTSLADLIPEFLTEIPADPFDPAHHALRYQPAAPVARLYSVGKDGVDDGGSMVDKTGLPQTRLRCTDMTFYLAPYTPPPR